MKIAELAVVAVLSVLAGCTGGPAGSRENWRRSSPYLPNPDLKKLSGISVLPEKPTDRQISEYLAEIEEASRGQRVFGSQDPQVDLLRRIGPGHLKLLIPYLDRKISSYLCWALPALVGEEEKELVISLLPEREEFLGIVVDRGWAEEARSEIVQLLKNGGANGAERVPEAVGQVGRTPEERAELTAVFLESPMTGKMFPAMEGFPEGDAKEIIWKACDNHRDEMSFSRAVFEFHAARYGRVDSLIYLLKEEGKYHCMLDFVGGEFAREELARLLHMPFDSAAMLEYVTTNRAGLRFDADERRYVLMKQEEEK